MPPPKKQRWLAPDLEPDRVWKNPEVLIDDDMAFPGCSSEANLTGKATSSLAHQVVSPKTQHLTPRNTINTTRHGTPVTFEITPLKCIACAIGGNFRYGKAPSDILPTTSFDQLRQKKHLGNGTDRCVWKGKTCVSKRIEFDEDIEIIEREVRTRESLIRAAAATSSPSPSPPKPPVAPPSSAATKATGRRHTKSPSPPPPPSTQILERRFHVIPLLAVVHKHAQTDEALGVLMPHAGTDLETLAGGCKYGMGLLEGEKPPRRPWPVIPVTQEQLADLVLGFVLFDLGTVAPDYKGDAYALGEVMLWVLDRVEWKGGKGSDAARVREAARLLKGKGDFEGALKVLDG
ncbi:hypothetical protein B0H63DRAFT_561744 [Podospora didyma]|uniref:Uncharacterized protein n=1 Tax=Podospora didyma TaxID=330526 RepID=A0AAE0NBU7_9PEZI|nr:hypothetical protein B0H63DRAFT_561744 [Podospora didyma]